MVYRSLIRPLLFRFDSESIHHSTLSLSKWISSTPLWRAVDFFLKREDSRLAQTLFGVHFKNPVGLAAGFDKDALAVPLLAALGFGCIEIGSVTAVAQPGNPKPRIFRFPEDGALINRMGFPSAGAEAVLEHLKRYQKGDIRCTLGINIGKSKITPIEKAPDDYISSFAKLRTFGDYFAVNVSSPNTPGLRQLQEKGPLRELLARLQEANETEKPLLLKIAPDLEFSALDDVIEVAEQSRIAAIIATNTTFSRERLTATTNEVGGMSGSPLYARSLQVVEYLSAHAPKNLPIVAVGGISSAVHALAYFSRGAQLVQLYTGLIMEGPFVVSALLRDLLNVCDRFSLPHICDLRGNKELCDEASRFLGSSATESL